MSAGFEALRLSHIVVPWLVVARRLRKGRKSFWADLSADAPTAAAAPVAEEPTSSAPVIKAKKNKKNKKRSEAVAIAPVASPVAAPVIREHHTFYCSACRAPIPLTDAPSPCPYCRTQVVPPPEVARAYQRVVQAKRALERAERSWRRAILWNGPVVVVLFALVIVVWSGSYFYLVIEASEQRAKLPWTKFDRLVLMASAPSGLSGWWTAVMLAVNADSLRKIVGRVPRAAFRALPAAEIACSHCGANAQFSEGRFTTVCAYCGAEEIRPTLAKGASDEARSVKKVADSSFIDAYRAIVKRRETLLNYVDIMALCAVVLVALEMLRWIPFIGKIYAFFE